MLYLHPKKVIRNCSHLCLSTNSIPVYNVASRMCYSFASVHSKTQQIISTLLVHCTSCLYRVQNKEEDTISIFYGCHYNYRWVVRLAWSRLWEGGEGVGRHYTNSLQSLAKATGRHYCCCILG